MLQRELLYAALGTGFTCLATVLGAGMVFFFKKEMSHTMQKVFLGFAAGVMIAASVWSLLIPAMEMAEGRGQSVILPVGGGFVLGGLFLMALDKLLPHLHIGSDEAEGLPAHWKRTTMIVLAVTLHNIPEGMAVAVPLISGGMSRTKAVLLTAVTGAPTVIGALLGFWVGMLSPLALSLSLSFASGAMLYVVLGELLPEGILMWRSKMPATAALVGILVGLLLIYV